MHRVHRFALATLLVFMGCAGVEVIRGNNSERDVVIRTAHDYLLATNVIDGTYQYEAHIPKPSFRPGSSAPPASARS